MRKQRRKQPRPRIARLFDRTFWRGYGRRCGVLAAVVSFVAVTTFYGAIIPEKAVLPTNPFLMAIRALGGAELEWPQLFSAERPLTPLEFAAQQPAIPVAAVSADQATIVTADGRTLSYAGSFRVTHYCACTICTFGTGITATGLPVAEGMAAADWSIFPPHTVIYIKRGDELIRKVIEDRGGAVQGATLDVYVPDHQQALNMGVYQADVYVEAA